MTVLGAIALIEDVKAELGAVGAGTDFALSVKVFI